MQAEMAKRKAAKAESKAVVVDTKDAKKAGKGKKKWSYHLNLSLNISFIILIVL